jgi:hypothetical protein
MMHAPSWQLDASEKMWKGLLWLGYAAAINAFIWSNAFCISDIHLNGGGFSPFLGAPVLAVSGAKMWDQCGHISL